MIPLFRQVVLSPQYINVKKFGAKGDGVTDDTAAIQAAINAKKKLYFPAGTYMINAETAIKPRDGSRLKLNSGATLQAITNAAETYQIIAITDCNDVKISGGSIVGERSTHTGETGEWGSGIEIVGSSNIEISNVNISDCWGDGIYVGVTASQNFCDNIMLSGITADNNRRTGIAVISAKNLTCLGCYLKNTNGVAGAEHGLNLEPNNTTEFLENIVIEDLVTENNAGYGLKPSLTDFVAPAKATIRIRNHKDTGSYGSRYNYYNFTAPTWDVTVDFANTQIGTPTNLATNHTFDDTTGWSGSAATLSAASNILSFTGDGTSTTTRAITVDGAYTEGDQIYVKTTMQAKTSKVASMKLYIQADGMDALGSSGFVPTIDTDYTFDMLKTLPAGGSGNIDLRAYAKYATAEDANGSEVQVSHFMGINLTNLYGKGYEPILQECQDIFTTWI